MSIIINSTLCELIKAMLLKFNMKIFSQNSITTIQIVNFFVSCYLDGYLSDMLVVPIYITKTYDNL